MKIIGIIPARYSSSRFPGKPLAMLGQKQLIRHVYERASEVLEHVFVATDDKRIQDAVKAFGGKAVLTSAHHQSGTDRCAEALTRVSDMLTEKFTHVINIQGDEPFIRVNQIETLVNSFSSPGTDIATLAIKIESREDIFDENKPKVVFDHNFNALYFTRSPVPFIRGLEKDTWPGENSFFKHIGIYAYRSDILEKISALPPSSLELAESLEQLRWLQNGYRIKVNITKYESIGIDTPEDLKKAIEITEKTSGA